VGEYKVMYGSSPLLGVCDIISRYFSEIE
jgi:hypothetical protein